MKAYFDNFFADPEIKEALTTISSEDFKEVYMQQKIYNYPNFLDFSNIPDLIIFLLQNKIDLLKNSQNDTVPYQQYNALIQQYNALSQKFNDLLREKHELEKQFSELLNKQRELVQEKVFLQNTFKDKTYIMSSQYEKCLERFYEQIDD